MITQVSEANLELLFKLGSQVDGPYKDPEEARRWMQKFIKKENYRAFIFVEDGVALGYVGCKFHEEDPPIIFESKVDHMGHIAKIGVHENARGRGIGKQLLEAAEQWIKSMGLPGVWLDYIPNGIRERLYQEYKVLAEYTETDASYSRRIAVKKW